MSFSPIEVIVLASFASLLTISVIQFINPLYDESKNIHVTTRILNFLWGLGAIFILYILLIILNVLPTSMKLAAESNILLSSIGISLSAFIASASVMKNIANTNIIEKEKIKRELFDRRKKVIFSISDLYKEVIERMDDYNSLQEIQHLKEIDNFSEEEYIKEFIPNLLNKEEEYVKKIREIMDSLDEAEFIFDEVYFKHLSPLMELLLEYYKEISIDQMTLEQKINSCSKLLNLSFEVLHEIKNSIKLV